jgi:hypothetical protein
MRGCLMALMVKEKFSGGGKTFFQNFKNYLQICEIKITRFSQMWAKKVT